MEYPDICLLDSSRKSAEHIASALRAHPQLLQEALQQAISGIQPQSWRVARSIEIAISVQPDILNMVEAQILASLPSLPQQTQRSFLKIYKTPSVAVSEQAIEVLLPLCFALLEDPSVATAVRGYSSQILERIAYQIPEILNELIELLEMLGLQGNSALARSARNSAASLSKKKRRLVHKKMRG